LTQLRGGNFHARFFRCAGFARSWTALIESIVLGNGGPRHAETLRALVRAGANVNLADRQGATPLQLARSRGYKAMVEILERARKVQC
jgi:ankyrin repeat protein